MTDGLDERREESRPPTGDQFTLRGMFYLMTGVCVVFALVAAFGVRKPVELAALAVIPIFCLLVILAIELIRRVTNRRGGDNPFQR